MNPAICIRYLVVFSSVATPSCLLFHRLQVLTMGVVPGSGDHVIITQSRLILAGVILVLVSRIAAQSRAELAPADLVKAVIRSELKTSDVTENRWKYLLVKAVDGKQE